MAMYNKIITFLMLTFIVSISFAQQYTPMTAAGYQYKRAKVDSTLHIPSFCGVPNLRNSTAIQGALAMDTCGNKLYQWTHAAGWSTISTNAIDSLKRSNDSIYARKSGMWVFQYKDSIGGGGTTPSLQDVATVGDYYANYLADTLRINSYDAVLDIKHPIIWTNDIGGGSPNNILDFSYGPSSYENVAKIKFGDATSSLGHGYIEMTDKQSYFKNEMSQRTIIQNTPSISGSNQITYFPLMKNGTDTLATTFDIRNSAIDTANKWVNNITRTSGKDSIIFYIGSTRYAIKDSVGNTTGYVPYTGATSDVDLGTHILNAQAIGVKGTNGNGHIDLRHQASDAASTGQTTALFADANGDLKWKNDGNYYTTLVTSSNTANRSYTFPNATTTLIGASDTATMLTPYLRKIDTASLSSRINLKVNISDTATMLTPYLRKIDTASLSSRINLKVNISDTASMLTPYLRSNTAAATYLAKSDSTTYYTKYRSDTSRTNIYNAINGKQAAGTYVTSVSGTSPISSSGGTTPAISISQASTSTNGYLSSTDWNTFNGKIGTSDTSVFLRKTDSATYYTKYRSDTSRTNIYNALNGKQGTLTLTTTGTSGAATLAGNTLNIPQYSGGTSYTFSTGLTNSANTITNNLSTGVSGGQSVVGGTAASNSLTLSSTSNATKGKILFGTSAYDEVNNRLGIGLNSPTVPVDISATDNLFNTQFNIANKSTGNNALTGLSMQYGTSNTPVCLIVYCPSNYVATGLQNTMLFASAQQQKLAFVANSQAIGGVAQDIYFSTLGTNTNYQMQIKGSTGNVQIGTNTDAGYKLDVNGTARVQGALNFNPTNTAAGTTGNQTINKTSGTVNIAAAGTTVTVTNSLVTTSSIVFAVLRTNDGTATIKNVVPAAGSFTINLAAAATAEVSIGFFVIN